MDTEPGIDIRREIQQSQNTFLQRGERRQMANGALGLLDNRKRSLLEGLQEPFSSRICRGPLGVSGVQPRQLDAVRSQVATDDEFEQGQDTQGDGQQTNQSGGMVVSRHVHWAQRERMSFQAPIATLNGVLVAVRQHSLGHWKLGCRGIRGIDAPSLALQHPLDSLIIYDGNHPQVDVDGGPRGVTSIAPHLSPVHAHFVVQTQQPVDVDSVSCPVHAR